MALYGKGINVYSSTIKYKVHIIKKVVNLIENLSYLCEVELHWVIGTEGHHQPACEIIGERVTVVR